MTKSRSGKILAAAVFLLLVFSQVFSHDMWLVPKKFIVSPGEPLVVFGNTGMDFPNSLNPVELGRVEAFFIVGNSGRKDISSLRVEGNSLAADLSIERPGTYVIAAALKPNEIRLTAEEFNEYVLLEGLKRIHDLRRKEGILEKDAVEYYSKFPKAIVQVGDLLDETPLKPADLTLEIVPKVNPYRLKAGERLQVTALFRGKPLPGAEFAWSYPGAGKEYAGSVIADGSGTASVPLEKAGPFMIRTMHMEWVKNPTHEWESFWTSLTFDVAE
jgi:hypothetical protein